MTDDIDELTKAWRAAQSECDRAMRSYNAASSRWLLRSEDLAKKRTALNDARERAGLAPVTEVPQ